MTTENTQNAAGDCDTCVIGQCPTCKAAAAVVNSMCTPAPQGVPVQVDGNWYQHIPALSEDARTLLEKLREVLGMDIRTTDADVLAAAISRV